MARLLHSAGYRIAFVYSAAFALATILLGVIVYLAAHAAFARQLDGRIAEDAAALVADYREDGTEGLREAIAEREAGNPTSDLGYVLFGPGGRRRVGALRTPFPARGWSNIVFVDSREGPDPARALAVDLPDGSRLVVAADREPLERIDATIVSLFGGAFAVVLLIGAGGALLLGTYLRRRIAGISATAEAIMAGNMAQRMPTGRHDDEFDRLARSLNAMLDRIAALLENLRQVSSDVAHDLRTPLARLRNQLERGLAGSGDADGQRAALQAAIERSDEVLALFAAILRISEIEEGSVRRAFAPLDLSALAADLCDSYAPATEDSGRRLECRIDAGAEIDGDRELIAQAVINLLDNAQRHTPPGSTVTLQLRRNGDVARLSVADDGPGVAEADRTRLTRRFARLEASRSTPGHGLGLNLVAAVARAHDAALSFADNRPGLVVALTFRRRGA